MGYLYGGVTIIVQSPARSGILRSGRSSSDDRRTRGSWRLQRMPYCPDCGHQHADDDRFCSKCGRGLAPGAASPAAVAPGSAMPVEPAAGLEPAAAFVEPAAPVAETLLW